MGLVSKAYRMYESEGLWSLCIKSYSFFRNRLQAMVFGLPLVSLLCYKLSERRLKSLMEHEETVEDTIDTAYRYQGFANCRKIRPLHARENIERLITEVNDLEPSIIVEIGAGYGGSFYMWSRAVPSAELIVSMDIDFSNTDRRLLEAIESDAETHFFKGSSHNEEILQRLQQMLDGRKIDLLYIDGDHSYDGVIKDYEMYTPLVRDGGVVMMDDIDNTTSAPEVPKAWADLAVGKDTETIKETTESSAQGVIHL